MIALWIAAAAVAQPPKLINGDKIITSDDYPGDALQAGSYGRVSMHLQVAESGKVSACAVTETSGSKPLDNQACRLARTRARFEPARDAAGLALPGEYRTAVMFGLEEHMPLLNIDIKMGVPVLPPDYRQPVKAHVGFGGDGHVMLCDIQQSSGSDAADRGVCDAIRRQIVITPPKSGSTEPAVALRFYTVTLVAAPRP